MIVTGLIFDLARRYLQCNPPDAQIVVLDGLLRLAVLVSLAASLYLSILPNPDRLVGLQHRRGRNLPCVGRHTSLGSQ
ncbi:hypothetical protein MRB53_023264 [Persea americana]|uniref:Uncharacterized protein n=1 Tax=Persea americana TaxID=3435 RepID=A0ACC2L925_PERAE|nr:hypothetical protein MRB53_023264 [Persea americana]